MPPDVSIIIPTYDGANFTRACLDSLWRNLPVGVAEVIVVDDASPSAEAGLLADELSRDSRVRFFRQERNGGFARACNRGIAESMAPLALLLNNDTEICPGWLEPLLEALGDRRVGAAGSLLLYPGGTVVQHAGVGLFRDGSQLRPFHFGQFLPLYATPQTCQDREVSAVTGASLLFRKDALPGGVFLDEAYRNGYEDVDLCLRLGNAGLKIRFCGGSRAIHHESVAVGRHSDEEKNRSTFQDRWRGQAGDQPSAEIESAMRHVSRRRGYLRSPTPANAFKVAKMVKRCGPMDELPLWLELARGRIFKWRGIADDHRLELHCQLGLDGVDIRR